VPSTVRPVIVSPDLDRLVAFYTALLGATETMRYPEQGAPFYVGLRVGDSELGVAADAGAALDGLGRLLLSIEVDAVDELLPRVEQLGGRVHGPSNDMPWGQRVAHVADPDGNTVNLTQVL
jgi:predicted enzyme related to lactoylglutathione lyase